jgi:hypothetical protein
MVIECGRNGLSDARTAGNDDEEMECKMRNLLSAMVRSICE